MHPFDEAPRDTRSMANKLMSHLNSQATNALMLAAGFPIPSIMFKKTWEARMT